jgi:hypothetical protein
VSIVEDDQGFTIVVRPAPVRRGREAHFGILAVLGPLLAFAVGFPLVGMTGVSLGPLGCVDTSRLKDAARRLKD